MMDMPSPGVNPQTLLILQRLLALVSDVAAMAQAEMEAKPKTVEDSLLELMRPSPHHGGFGYSS